MTEAAAEAGSEPQTDTIPASAAKADTGVPARPGSAKSAKPDVSPPPTFPSRVLRFFDLRRFDVNRLLRYFGLFIVLSAVASASISFLVLTGATPIEPEPDVWMSIWVVNAVLVLIVVALVLAEAVMLVQSRLRKEAGAGLHTRLVGLFAFGAALPAFIVATVAIIALNQGLDQWFSDRTRAMVESSRLVARSYMLEHADVLRDDVLGVTHAIEEMRNTFDDDRETFERVFTAISQERGLPWAFLLNADREVILRAKINTPGRVPVLPQDGLEGVEIGQPTNIAPGRTNLIGSVVKLRGYEEVYLFAARPVDPQVLEYMRLTDQNVTEYREYESSRLVFQVTFAIMYLGLALVVLLAAVWIGIALANRLVAPIRNLMIASSRVSQGDLDVQVPVTEKRGDMHDLSVRFNLMTQEIKSQRQLLLRANQMIDQRRQFTEAVLEGVSAGVVGLDQFARVNLVNGRAASIFNMAEPDLVGVDVAKTVPELKGIVDLVSHGRRGQSQQQITFNRTGQERTYQVRITREGTVTNSKGFVITLDDITELMAAQRTSAWADVAQRIAHEIKNPLTPIQLSAERLRRRYAERLADDIEVFDKCTSTIVRQVGDIGRMVDEFSAFARMPVARIESGDLADAVRQAVFSESVRHPHIKIETDIPEGTIAADFDARLITQALTNVIKNAAEALEGMAGGKIDDPRIVVSVRERENDFQVLVSDNGPGWPKDARQKLLEPYVTTRDKGTGLGLAIVLKIVEQHSGEVELLDSQLEPGTKAKSEPGTKAKSGPARKPRAGRAARRGACLAFTLTKTVPDTLDVEKEPPGAEGEGETTIKAGRAEDGGKTTARTGKAGAPKTEPNSGSSSDTNGESGNLPVASPVPAEGS
ncbi:MAG: PAS domain-containing sensor histidine kinase [Alphaproteobacteria bacterium]|nr:PAS domain-containing sensor histidine kinase [Alphaproteobacteria bacterium]